MTNNNLEENTLTVQSPANEYLQAKWIISQIKGRSCLAVSQSQCFIGVELPETQELLKFEGKLFLQLDTAKEKFDNILLVELLEYVDNPEEYIEKSIELCGENGQLIIQVPFTNTRCKHTYLFSELYKQVSKYATIVSYTLLERTIGYICVPKSRITEGITIDLNLLESVEIALSSIVKELAEQNKLKQKRINVLLEEREKKSKRIQHLEEDREKLRNKINAMRTSENNSNNNKIRRILSSIKRRLFSTNANISPNLMLEKIDDNTKTNLKIKTIAEMNNNANSISNQLSPISDTNVPMNGNQENVSSILFMCTNGAGLGHLTRSLAIAKRIRKLDPEKEIIFLTTSIAVNIVSAQGFQVFHIPPKNLLHNMDATKWGGLLKRQLLEIFSLYNIKEVVFDGAFPYVQFIQTVSKYPGVKKIWVKRGGEKAGTEGDRQKKEELFDYIIIPGENGAELPENDEKHYAVDPIVYINDDELLSKENVRKLFKVPKEYKLVYVQLGAGNINDISNDLGKVIAVLRKSENVMIVLGESIISLSSTEIYDDKIYVVKDYPNSKYFQGFDFVISACGYNSFQELTYMGIPTIYLPNMQCKTDDQYGRALLAVNAGAALVLNEVNETNLQKAINTLLDDKKNLAMRNAATKLKRTNGAEKAAEFILNKLEYEGLENEA